MREILFQGKWTRNDKWVEGFYARVFDGKGNVSHRIYSGYAESDCGDFYPEWYEVDPSTIGQYTGLTDKNGKKIFEGDICIIEHDDCAFDGMTIEFRKEQGTIEYDNFGMLGLVVEKYKGENVWSDFFHVLALTDRIVNWTLEVIGNKWDNPELLEVEG